MSKQWGKECHQASGLCGNGEPWTWCEGQQPCQGGGVGLVGEDISLLSPAQIEASTNKFYGTYTKEGGLKLIEVGGLREAGVEPGNVLLGVYPNGQRGFQMSNKDERQQILRWSFPVTKILSIVIERDNQRHTLKMKNPAT